MSDTLAERLAGLARARGWPDASDPQRLGAAVAALSGAYNRTGRSSPADMAARLGFFLPRDQHKVAEALRPVRGRWHRPIRLLDLGAGLGASALGVTRVMDVAHATLVDADPVGLSLARGVLDVALDTRVADAGRFAPGPADAPWELIVASQVLSELDQERPDRAERHAALVCRWMEWLSPDGVLLLVEPALRERSRHLLAVRDRVAPIWPPLAPCTHNAACPALADSREWCHERRELSLSPELVAVARAAGLSWERVDFSYLVLCRDRQVVPPEGSLRVVSDVLPSRGKTERFLCGPFGAAARVARQKVQRLDRHQSEANATWDQLERGDRVTLTHAGAPLGDTRVLPDTVVAPCDG